MVKLTRMDVLLTEAIHPYHHLHEGFSQFMCPLATTADETAWTPPRAVDMWLLK